MTGAGDVNTYALFAEHFARLARTEVCTAPRGETIRSGIKLGCSPPVHPGRAGIIVPTGVATDSTTSIFFGAMVAQKRLAALFSFFEVRRWFKDTEERKPFCILVVGRHNGPTPVVFGIRSLDEIFEKERQILLGADDFSAFNPNTRTAPLFHARADRALTEKLYRTAKVLIRERPDHPDGEENPWGVSFRTFFHMSNDSRYFRTAQQLLEQKFERNGLNWENEHHQSFVPLYEAKMIHHFDHRFGSYEGLHRRPPDGILPGLPDSAKTNPRYDVEPWYWVPEVEATLRAAGVPSRLKQYYRNEDATGCLRVLAEWVLGTFETGDLLPDRLARTIPLAISRLRDVLGVRSVQRETLGTEFSAWVAKRALGARKMQCGTPLTEEDLTLIKDAPQEPLELTRALIERKQPRWLMGWRDITNATSERTVVAGVFPRAGVGHKLPIVSAAKPHSRTFVLLAQLSSLVVDYVARQKLAGTDLTYFYIEQLPILAPDQFSKEDLAFLNRRMLELTYTSYSMRAWADDLGYTGAPFVFDTDRRAQLRAEIDAFVATKFGLKRDDLRYILEPADTHGKEYPSETFRVLKQNEIGRYGEYRTQRLVLEAYDRLTGV